MQDFSLKIIEIIQSIPAGKVMTYGQISLLAGKPRGARQVSRILHTCSRKHNLPWHRVINSQGRISLPHDGSYERQFLLLENEAVIFDLYGSIDLNKYLWQGDTI